MTTTYLCRREVAHRIGVTPGALSRYKLPEPDAITGKVRGWLEETVDQWNAARPGRGARTDLVRDGSVLPGARVGSAPVTKDWAHSAAS